MNQERVLHYATKVSGMAAKRGRHPQGYVARAHADLDHETGGRFGRHYNLREHAIAPVYRVAQVYGKYLFNMTKQNFALQLDRNSTASQRFEL